MGRLHVRVYSQMPNVKVMGVFDASAETAATVADEFAAPAIKNLEDLFPQVDAVTIAVPTKFHLDIARPCIERKIACLIEKPLAKDASEGRQIVELAQKHNVTVQVGHIERFNPAIRAHLQAGDQATVHGIHAHQSDDVPQHRCRGGAGHDDS